MATMMKFKSQLHEWRTRDIHQYEEETSNQSRAFSYFVGLFALWAIGVAQANPLVVDSVPRPVRMVAEDVRIEVGEGVAWGKGEYLR